MGMVVALLGVLVVLGLLGGAVWVVFLVVKRLGESRANGASKDLSMSVSNSLRPMLDSITLRMILGC